MKFTVKKENIERTFPLDGEYPLKSETYILEGEPVEKCTACDLDKSGGHTHVGLHTCKASKEIMESLKQKPQKIEEIDKNDWRMNPVMDKINELIQEHNKKV